MLALVASLMLSQVAVDRETPTYAQNTRYYFSSRSEADAAQFGWKKVSVAFRAFLAPQPGLVPVYCDTLGHSTYRFTRQDPLPGWERLFVAFYAFPEPKPGLVPIYEESLGDQYNYASRTAEEAAQYGWARGHVAFWAVKP